MSLTTIRLWQMAATDKAYRFSKTPPERPPDPVWIPRSVIERVLRRPPKEPGAWPECEVTMQEWTAEKFGAI